MPFPIQRKYIEETEKELDLKFPESYKVKMEIENGGELTINEEDWILVPFFDKADNTRISRTANHIIRETNEAKNWGNFPHNAVVIAENDSGDYLVLLLEDGDTKKLKGEIYQWLHETGVITEVAKDISEILYK